MFVASHRHIFDDYETVAQDEGTMTIEAGTLDSLDDDHQTDCELTVHVTRYRMGEVDDAFGEGGSIEARQTRSVSIHSSP